MNDIDRLVTDFGQRKVGRRQFVRRALALGLSSTAAGGLLAACARDSDPASAPTTPAARPSQAATEAPEETGSPPAAAVSGPVQILVGFGTGNQPEQVAEEEALAAAFTELNPEVSIEFLRVPSGSSDAQQRLTLAISSDQAPDLVMPTGVFGMGLFLDRDVWLDIGPLAERDGIDVSAYRDNALMAARATAYYGEDSTALIGLPVAVHTHVLAYNASLFDQFGVDRPPTDWSDESWTFEKLREAAIALTRDTNGNGPQDAGFDAESIAHFGLGHYFPETMFFAFGGQRWIPEEMTFGFDRPGTIAGLQFAADLINVDKVQPNQQALAGIGGGASGGDAELFAWLNGRLAMVDMCTCDFTESSYAGATDFEWAVAAMPTGPERRFAFLNLDLGAITKAAPNPEAAWEVLKFFAIDMGDEFAFDTLGAIPPRKDSTDAFNESVTMQFPNVDPAVVTDALPFAGGDNERWFPAFSEVNTAQNEAVSRIISGETDAATAMAALQPEAERLAMEWFANNTLPSG